MSVYNTQRTITLNTKGSLSGPYYRVEFSNDCINYYTSSYTASINPVYINPYGPTTASYSSTVYASMSIVDLPNVGSTASILVPNDACCIKLINLSDNCYGNEYVESICSTTTTTTTIVVNPCRCYEVVFGSGGGEINYNDCDGETFNFVSSGATTYYQCVQVIGGLAQIFVISGDVTLNIVGNCLTGPCPPTTTTSTTTTTTTTPPSSDWRVANYDCGGGTLNDVGINSNFIGTLSGPSTFPLTSTLYGDVTNPGGINYGTTNTIQFNVTTNIAGTGNCGVVRVEINSGARIYETYFTTNPYPQIANVVINSGDDVFAYVQCYTGACPSTTTSTSTTTTTTSAPTYNYYDVTRFTCPSCTSPTGGIVARNNTTGGTLTTGNYYNNGDGYVYRIDGYNAGSSYTINLDSVASAGTNCSGTCAI
jgi:hypothetical protein